MSLKLNEKVSNTDIQAHTCTDDQAHKIHECDTVPFSY